MINSKGVLTIPSFRVGLNCIDFDKVVLTFHSLSFKVCLSFYYYKDIVISKVFFKKNESFYLELFESLSDYLLCYPCIEFIFSKVED